MKPINKLLLVAVFALTMGCGEQSSGEDESAAVGAGEPVTQAAAPAQSQVAALSDVATNGLESDALADVSSANYVAGTHYEVLPKPVATADKNRIEVAEVFWYGCSHCYDFEPKIEAWAENAPDDVLVVKSPAMWDKQGIMALHARIYYTAKALGVLDTVSPAAFRALNVERRQLRTEGEIAELFTENGVSKEDFERTFNSFGVTSSVRQAEARQRSYRVQGTPEVIVDGTYRISSRMAGSHEAVLKVTEFLIEKIREEKAGS